MGAYYTYLISSLPMLNFPAKPPFSLEDFFTKCKELIPEAEIEFLRHACDKESYLLNTSTNSTLKEWANFEIALRNELARLRGRRKKIDPAKFIRFPDSPQAQISHMAMAAYRSTALLEAENILDQGRWNFLESLSCGHYFDLDFLLLYALKLKILQRWEKIQKADKEVLLNAATLN